MASFIPIRAKRDSPGGSFPLSIKGQAVTFGLEPLEEGYFDIIRGGLRLTLLKKGFPGIPSRRSSRTAAETFGSQAMEVWTSWGRELIFGRSVSMDFQT